MSLKNHQPAARLYIANLDYRMTVEDVKNLFEDVGQVVDVYLPAARGTNHHKGYGFVEMESPELAQLIIDTLHGEKDDFGRQMTIRIADRDQNNV